jgi:hypothetical protein
MKIGRPEWTYRSHEDYDPNQIGAISQARIAAALIEAGKIVLAPLVQVMRYDVVIEDRSRRLNVEGRPRKSRFYRVQCKTGHLHRGAVVFSTQSLRAAKRETEWRRVASDYQGDIDYFGVFCPDNGCVYLVPIKVTATKRMCCLRIEPPKNNQKKRIRWAKDYEVVPAVRRY